MAVGLFRTTVYLPHEHYTAQELEMIFRHELIHWQRKDLWYKLLLLAARSIHWCNPLVWRMAKRAERDLEISCDSMAVQGRDAAYRKAYGLMILQEAEAECLDAGYEGGLLLTVFVPDGEALAKKTFNPQIGIQAEYRFSERPGLLSRKACRRLWIPSVWKYVSEGHWEKRHFY